MTFWLHFGASGLHFDDFGSLYEEQKGTSWRQVQKIILNPYGVGSQKLQNFLVQRKAEREAKEQLEKQEMLQKFLAEQKALKE